MIRYRDNGEREETFRKCLSLVCGNHIHPMAEVVFVKTGYVVASVNGKAYRADAGDVIITPPNSVHGYIKQEDITGYIIVLNLADYPEHENLKRIGMPIINNVLTEENLPLFEACFNMYNSSAGFKIKRSIVSLLLSIALSKASFDVKESNLDITGKAIYNYCYQNYKRNISIDEVAVSLGMSRGNLSRIFSKKFNISFTDYINMLRIEDAKKLLVRTDKAISLIAEECGFGTVRTFNRVFLKSTGSTPKDYRKHEAHWIT